MPNDLKRRDNMNNPCVEEIKRKMRRNTYN